MRASRLSAVAVLVTVGLAAPLAAPVWHRGPSKAERATATVGIELGGDWSTYWYDGEIHESDITRGLIIWELKDRAVRDTIKLGQLNPQTQEFTIDSRGRKR